jgi:hypothetical protein
VMINFNLVSICAFRYYAGCFRFTRSPDLILSAQARSRRLSILPPVLKPALTGDFAEYKRLAGHLCEAVHIDQQFLCRSDNG